MAKEKKISAEEYGRMLEDRYERWQTLSTKGGQDPFYADGTNMNLVRNHIFNYRHQIEESLASEEYPESYYLPVPDKVDDGYIARKEEIMANAKRSLKAYEANEGYKYMLSHIGDFSDKTLDKIYAGNVIGYVSGLKSAIEKGDYVYMRRHEDSDRYIDLFSAVAEKMETLPAENIQIDIFSSSGSAALSDGGIDHQAEGEGISMAM